MDDNLFLNLIKASKKARKIWIETIKKDGAEDTLNSYFLLKACHLNGCDRKDLPVITGIDNAYIAKSIQNIVDEGLAFKTEGHRKNAYRLNLTDHGHEVLAWLDTIYDQARDNFTVALTKKDIEEITTILNALLNK